MQKLTLIDYPGKVAAIIFTQGCNLRCGYCHNRELVLPEYYGPLMEESSVLAFLTKRSTQLQGVVVTGGEPTVQKDLPEFLGKLKALGLAVKLDTNGTLPRVLEHIIHQRLIDYIAMDIKTSWEKYRDFVGADCQINDIKKSIQLIIRSGIEHEFRTTVVKKFCGPEDLLKIRDYIGPEPLYRLQAFQPSDKIIDPALLRELQNTS